RAPHRRDEATGRAHRMGEYRQPGGGHVELGRLESEAAPSEYGAVIYRLSSVQTRAAAPARASANSRALRRRAHLAENGTVQAQAHDPAEGDRGAVPRGYAGLTGHVLLLSRQR